MYKVLGQDLADGLGFSTVAASITMSLIEWFSMISVNEILHSLASVGGLCFLFYKIKHLRVEIKIKKQELKKYKKANNEK